MKKVFFITTRGLCCCDGATMKPEGTVFETEFEYSRGRGQIWKEMGGNLDKGVSEPPRTTVQPPAWREDAVLSAKTVASRPPDTGLMTIDEANALSGTMREVMLGSLVSPRRTEPRPISETRMLNDLVLPSLLQDPSYGILLRQPAVDVIPKELEKRLSKTFLQGIKNISRHDLLQTSVPILARASGLPESDVHQLKAAMLTKPFRVPIVPKEIKAVQQSKAKSGKRLVAKQRRSAKQPTRKSSK